MKDTGGPAFPHPSGWRRDPEISDGMTLRDYFAAKAMQAYINRKEAAQVQDRMIAECAYDMADAMLAQRDKV
jgi:hypothetical protein